MAITRLARAAVVSTAVLIGSASAAGIPTALAQPTVIAQGLDTLERPSTTNEVKVSIEDQAGVLTPSDQDFMERETAKIDFPADSLLPLKEMEKQYIQKVLSATDNNQTKAAEILQIDRKTLRDKIK